jgi:hypothetical protein
VPAVDVHVPGREKNSQVEQPGLYLTSGVVGYLAGFFMNRNHAARPTAENGKEVDDWPLETGSHSQVLPRYFSKIILLLVMNPLLAV